MGEKDGRERKIGEKERYTERKIGRERWERKMGEKERYRERERKIGREREK